ncbi:hypothetical protein B0H13DRAFT_644901 [Mycena leptocephala]|nr:hypothetical protein B0H13DRAFT_644901 [Mycena leptocephala]
MQTCGTSRRVVWACVGTLRTCTAIGRPVRIPLRDTGGLTSRRRAAAHAECGTSRRTWGGPCPHPSPSPSLSHLRSPSSSAGGYGFGERNHPAPHRACRVRGGVRMEDVPRPGPRSPYPRASMEVEIGWEGSGRKRWHVRRRWRRMRRRLRISPSTGVGVELGVEVEMRV